jgi:hypothetical protein
MSFVKAKGSFGDAVELLDVLVRIDGIRVM